MTLLQPHTSLWLFTLAASYVVLASPVHLIRPQLIDLSQQLFEHHYHTPVKEIQTTLCRSVPCQKIRALFYNQQNQVMHNQGSQTIKQLNIHQLKSNDIHRSTWQIIVRTHCQNQISMIEKRHRLVLTIYTNTQNRDNLVEDLHTVETTPIRKHRFSDSHARRCTQSNRDAL